MYTFSQFRPNPTRKLILIYSEYQSKLSEALSKRIQEDLKAAHMVALQTDKVIDCPQVPFTVVIKERTMEDGVLELQHQKPRIREEVHVRDLTGRILLQTGGGSCITTQANIAMVRFADRASQSSAS